jgi:tRNA-splicing ligase RtcB
MFDELERRNCVRAGFHSHTELQVHRVTSEQSVVLRRIDKELEARGVIAMCSSSNGLAEEQPKAYKFVDDVVDTVQEANLSRKVARMRPIGVIKG